MGLGTRLRDLVLHNLGLKLASIVLALVLYAHVVTDQQREARITLPVALSGVPDSLVVLGQPPARVAVNVRGKWKDLIRLGLTGRQLSVDLTGARPGRLQKSISIEDVRERAIPAELSKAVEVTEVVEPRTIDLVLEPKRRKSVPVAARIVGAPAPGFAVRGEAEVAPDTAWVVGPASALASLDTLYTLPVDIRGERERIQRQVQLDAGPNLVSVEPRRCIVTLRIAREADEAPSQHL